MSPEALIAIVANETADIEDTDERLRRVIELAIRLLDVYLASHN